MQSPWRGVAFVPESRLLAVLAEATRSHTPLQPAWLSTHSTAMPAWWATSSRFSWLLRRLPKASRPRCENMQGTDAAVLMVAHHIHRVVVVDDEQRAVGVVSSLDVVNAVVSAATGLPPERIVSYSAET